MCVFVCSWLCVCVSVSLSLSLCVCVCVCVHIRVYGHVWSAYFRNFPQLPAIFRNRFCPEDRHIVKTRAAVQQCAVLSTFFPAADRQLLPGNCCVLQLCSNVLPCNRFALQLCSAVLAPPPFDLGWEWSASGVLGMSASPQSPVSSEVTKAQRAHQGAPLR